VVVFEFIFSVFVVFQVTKCEVVADCVSDWLC